MFVDLSSLFFEGDAIQIDETTEKPTINVLFDDKTIHLDNSELGIHYDSEQAIDVKDGVFYIKVDDDSVHFNDRGQLEVQVDSERALEITNGKIGVRIDNKTIEYKNGELHTLPTVKSGIATLIVREDDSEVVNIVYDSEKGLGIDANNQLFIKLDEQKGLSFDSEGKVFLKVDGETVHINPTSGELELHLNDRRGIGNDSEGLFVKVDGETIVINSEGKLESAFSVNEALEIVTSEGHPVANVRRDNKTIHLNSDHNWLELHPDPQRAFNVDSEGKLYVKFDGDSYPLDSEASTIILNANGELHVKNYVPNFNDSEKVDKALRVTKDGNDYKLEWRAVSDLDDIALKLSGFETSEGAKYQKKYYYASSEAAHIIPDQTPIRYDATTRTVFIDLSSKQNQIGDGILIEDPSVTGNF